MEFVDGDGGVLPVECGAVAHPGAIGPLVTVEIDDHGAGFGAQFGGEGVGIGFECHHLAGAREDFEFVEAAFGERGDENLPDAGGAVAHGMDAAVPAVEIADDADAQRVGRPDGEMHAGDSGNFAEMRAELVVILEMSAFAEEVKIVIGENGRESEGVVGFDGLVLRGGGAQAIGVRRNGGACNGRGGKRRRGERDKSFEKSGRMDLLGGMLLGIFAPENRCLRGVRLKSADEDAGFARGRGAVGTEDGKWLGMLAANN